GLLFGVFVLLMLLLDQRQRGATTSRPSAPALQPQAANQILNQDADDDVDEPPNPPYPLVADLAQTGEARIPGEPPARNKPTARDRFLEISIGIWNSAQGQYPTTLAISPDGQQIAYVQGQTLWAGPIGGNIQAVGVGQPNQRLFQGGRQPRGQVLAAG